MVESGVEAAIRELEKERKKIAGVISMLRRIRPSVSANTVRRRWRLSAEARRKISAAAKKRWAARKGAAAKARK